MGSSLWQIAAAREAEALILELGISTLPVCPFAIARELDIEVRPLPTTKRGVSGMLLRFNDVFGIFFATYLGNAGFERFSVGHEIGHFRLPGHPELVLRTGAHASEGGFVSKDQHELEADHFSAALLMPGKLFDRVMDRAGSGLDAVDMLARECETSLTATAIRYAQRTPDPVAVVVSTGQSIDYCFMSDSLRELRGIDWMRKGSVLPRSSVTHTFNDDLANVIGGQRTDGSSHLQEWFGGSLDVDLEEEVVGLGNYGKTLTVLTATDLPDPQESDDEQEMIDSWTPKFRR